MKFFSKTNSFILFSALILTFIQILSSQGWASTVKVLRLETIEGYSFPIIEISSKTGIGSAKMVFPYNSGKTRFGIKLNLKGLEKFIISGRKFSHMISVNSSTGEVFQGFSLKTNPNGWISISNESAYWLKIRKSLHPEYFEIVIPPTVSQYLGSEVSFKWIDFYR